MTGPAWNGFVHGVVLRQASDALLGVARPLPQWPTALVRELSLARRTPH